MATKVEICNQALMKLGQAPIMGIDDNSVLAKQCAAEFENALGVVLRAYQWPFAIQRVRLAMSSEKPAFGFANYFMLPNDVARIREIDTNGYKYQIESNYVATDSSSVNLIYVSKNIDPIALDAQTVEVVALYLAYKLSIIVTENINLKDMLLSEYNMALAAARNTWSIEDYPQETIEGTWLTSRFGLTDATDTYNPWGADGTGVSK